MARRILVCNDQHGTLAMYDTFLKREGFISYPILQRQVGQNDIDTIKPDLIILDWTLGAERLGYTLLQQIRAFPQSAMTPVIVCTAGEEKKIASYLTALQEQQIDVLRKPFEMPELLSLIEKNLLT